jgi:biopolymer transport protein ExbB
MTGARTPENERILASSDSRSKTTCSPRALLALLCGPARAGLAGYTNTTSAVPPACDRGITRRMRKVLPVVMLLAFAAPLWAQDAAPAPQAGVVRMILGNIDFIFITIGVLSVAGLTLIIRGFIQQRRSVYLPPEVLARIRELIDAKQYRELLEYTSNEPSFVSQSLHPALRRAPSFSAMKEAMETAVAEQTAEQFRGIEYLNIIGNLGPLLGLLGTVLGMIHAFSAMQASAGKTDPAVLAGGISTALTHTFLGLFLAVPCLAAFGVLRTIIDRLTVQAALACEDLLLAIKPADARPAIPSASVPSASLPPTPVPSAVVPPPATGRRASPTA